MKYFNNITSLADLKSQYRELALKNHPDMGGSTEKMQAINAEFDLLFPMWKNKTAEATTEYTSETAQQFKRTFYTENGWAGERYDSSLSGKEISVKIREFCKTVYPDCKFSVTTDSGTWCTSINIALMEAPYFPFVDENHKTYSSVNHYHIDSDTELTERTKEMMRTVIAYAQSYNYDDSDSMTDYFDTNFYLSVYVGKWDKPFKVVQRTARLTDKTPETAKARTEGDDKEYYTYDIKKDTDTRDNSEIYVVKVKEKLSRESYKKLEQYIRSIGGYYSRFKHGFLFRSYPTELAKEAP